MKWRRINLPENVYREIARVARSRGIAMWKVVVEMVSVYRAARRQPGKRPVSDKVAWYITKLTMSAGEFRGNPNDRNRKYFMRTIEQIESRLEVDLSELKSVVRSYDGSKQARKTLNDVVKLAIMKIIEKTG
ncbi:MAG: hypothetical protein DRJ67_11890 [Thermoprotei archaeon]|nr:MAG: hypothetical protein DRJ67_11890 [Thermoprotei archaeon]